MWGVRCRLSANKGTPSQLVLLGVRRAFDDCDFFKSMPYVLNFSFGVGGSLMAVPQEGAAVIAQLQRAM